MIVSKNPSKLVGNVKLGVDFWEIHVTEASKKCEELVRPFGQLKTTRDAVGNSIAWKSVNVIFLFLLAFTLLIH